MSKPHFPHHTLIANLLACLILGYVYPMVQLKMLSLFWGQMLLFGFLAALSTFASFIADFYEHLQGQKPLQAFCYALITLAFKRSLSLFRSFYFLWISCAMIKPYFIKWLYLAIGAFIGTFLRVVILSIGGNDHFYSLSWHFLVINLGGAFLAGILFSSLKKRISVEMQIALFVGFLGSFTTFSDLILISDQLFLKGKTLFSLLYLLGTCLIGLLLFVLGIQIGKRKRRST